ncbi:MAG: hypothetical protein ACTHJ6_15565, partial [Oryzihumus sp.]
MSQYDVEHDPAAEETPEALVEDVAEESPAGTEAEPADEAVTEAADVAVTEPADEAVTEAADVAVTEPA